MLGGSCGLQVHSFHGHKQNHEKQHVRVDYVCTNPHHGKNMTVLDDAYFTVYGMLCGLCKLLLVTKMLSYIFFAFFNILFLSIDFKRHKMYSHFISITAQRC